jgi:glycosyltransferase involved in cell wall biosynthesis
MIGLDISSLADPESTGCQRYILNLIREMEDLKKDKNFTYFLKMSRFLKKKNIPKKELGESSINYFQPPIWLPRTIDVFHGPDARCPRYWGPFKVPTVVTIHDTFMDNDDEEVKTSNPTKRRKEFKQLSKTVDQVIVPSNSTKTDLLDTYSFSSSNINIIPEAPDPVFEPPTKKQLKGFRNTYQLPDRYILAAGSDTKRKNTLRTCKAFLNSSIPPKGKLVLYGHSYRDWLVEKLSTEAMTQIVTFEGITDEELRKLYGGSEYFVFASLYEGFGLPILEAMACGISVITSDRSSMREVGRKGSLLVNPKSKKEISEAMVKLWEDDSFRNYLEDKAKEHVKSYSWKKTTEEHIKVYEDAMNTN